ncbi:MAG: hypothetical protein NTV97_17260 [Alphaproteobacteria bacterium]|nr:hypothetical protein [Alphaproteobacteria bacterium]
MALHTLHPILKNTIVLLASGLVASVLCAKVFAATLPADEPLQIVTLVAASATTVKTDDVAAAKALRAFIAGQRPASALMANGNGITR